MRDRVGRVLWGLFFIVVGIGIGGQVFGVWHFNLFFDGWWTLFIIVPCFISIIQQGFNTGNTFGLLVGVMLLLWRQGTFPGVNLGALIFPVLLVFIGLSILFHKSFYHHHHHDGSQDGGCRNKDGIRDYTAVFGGQNIKIENEEFPGADITAVFGGVELDLRSARITQDAVIDVTAVFGGADIFVPNGVNIKVASTPIFGGVSNKTGSANVQGAHTIFINGTCIFGGVTIK